MLAAIETESDRVQWAAAGSNVTLYLTAIDPIHLDVGRVLCSPSAPVELASAFAARIIVFDIQVPILAGTSVSEKIDHPLANHVSCKFCSDRALSSFSRCPSGDI